MCTLGSYKVRSHKNSPWFLRLTSPMFTRAQNLWRKAHVFIITLLLHPHILHTNNKNVYGHAHYHLFSLKIHLLLIQELWSGTQSSKCQVQIGLNREVGSVLVASDLTTRGVVLPERTRTFSFMWRKCNICNLHNPVEIIQFWALWGPNIDKVYVIEKGW